MCTRQGRLLAIPNTLQHRAEPFHLVDPARPGHQKILAMYLVDPHIPVLSTANVPPQRKDWWADEIRKVSPFRSLPQEIFLQIMDMVDWFPLSGEEACAVRDELVRERNLIADGLDEMMNEVCPSPFPFMPLNLVLNPGRCRTNFASEDISIGEPCPGTFDLQTLVFGLDPISA